MADKCNTRIPNSNCHRNGGIQSVWYWFAVEFVNSLFNEILSKALTWVSCEGTASHTAQPQANFRVNKIFV